MRNNYAVTISQTGEELRQCPTYKQAAHYVTTVNRAGFLPRTQTLEITSLTYEAGKAN